MRLRAVGLEVEERQEPDQMSLDFTECGEGPTESCWEQYDLSYILAPCSCWEVTFFYRGSRAEAARELRGYHTHPRGSVRWLRLRW